MRAVLTLLVVSLLVLAMACGGGDDDGSDGAGSSGDGAAGNGASGSSDGGSSGGGSSDGGSSGGAASAGAPTLAADPGMTWAEVAGERIEYRANGSQHYECSVDPAQRVQVNYQTGDGHDFSLNAALQGDGWIGNITFKGEGSSNVQFSASIPGDAESFGVAEGAFSFEGNAQKVVDFDVANAETVSAQIAVNCAWPGGDPTAVLDGQTYTFPASGAQSFSCSVSSEEVTFDKSGGDSQLQIDARKRTANAWLGVVAVYTDAGNFTSTVPEDGAGLTIDGSSVHYEGVFTDPSGGEVEGTVDASCS